MFRLSFVADHFQYLASLALVALGSAGAARLWGSWDARNAETEGRGDAETRRHGDSQDAAPDPHAPRLTTIGCLLSLALLSALAVLTWRRSAIYCSAETLYNATLAGNPDCWLIQNNLGMMLLEAGRLDEATDHFQRALAANPRLIEAHVNLGNVRVHQQRIDEAAMEYRKALQISPANAKANFNLAIVLIREGQLKEAIPHLEATLEAEPDHAEARARLAEARARVGP
jgi:tetratricopeptide (TPR) repeat protein